MPNLDANHTFLDERADIMVLKNDVNRINASFQKLETVIEKMGEVSNSIARMLAVHEQRLTTHESMDKELFALIEKRKEELQVDVKELHSRITTVQRELSNEITHTEEKIREALTGGLAEIKKCITGEHEAYDVKQREFELRLRRLEQWRWFVVGISAGFGYLLKYLADIYATK